jgi:hypothetical protein
MATPDFDPYAVLGIFPNAAPDEIRAAYRRLAAVCHPDTQPEAKKAWATEQMVKLNTARDLLLNMRRRVQYHREPADALWWQVEKNRWREREAQATNARRSAAEVYPPRQRSLWLVYMLAGFVLFILNLSMLPLLLELMAHPADAAKFSDWGLAVIVQQFFAWLTTLGGFTLAALLGLGVAGLLALLFLGLTRRWKR